MAGAYRKRQTLGLENPGVGPGVFETRRLGRIGVLICYDVEHDHLVEETLALSPSLIVVPAHISGPMGISEHTAIQFSAWRTGASQNNSSPISTTEPVSDPLDRFPHCDRPAIDTMSRRLDFLSQSSGVPILRVDVAFPDGCGNTFISTPTQTVLVPSMETETFVVHLPTLPPPKSLEAAATLTRERSERQDNVGTRTLVRTWKLAHAETVGAITCLASRITRSRPKGRLLVGTAKGFVCQWDVAPGTEVPGPPIDCLGDKREGKEGVGVTELTPCLQGEEAVVAQVVDGTRLLVPLPAKGSGTATVLTSGDQTAPAKTWWTLVCPRGPDPETSPAWVLTIDRDGRAARLWREGPDQSWEDAGYVFPSPMGLRLLHVHYCPAGWLAMATESAVHIIDMYANRVPLKLADLVKELN